MLALLRAQLWLMPVDDIQLPSSKEEYDELMDLAYRQTVVCFISAACLRHRDAETIPSEIRDEMYAVIEENKKIHELHNKTIVEVFTLFENSGIHPILLKGQGLAQLYPQPELRQCGDIDIYIGQADYEKACRIMDGYCGPSAKENAFYEDQLHYHIFNGSITFEVHRKAVDAAKPYKDKEFNVLAYGWLQYEKCDTILINDKMILVPNPQYNTLYVFDHLIKHIRCKGVNLRQFCDWMMVVYSNSRKIDYACLLKDIKNVSSIKAWQTLGGILFYQLGMKESLFPLWNDRNACKSQKIILQELINSGSFYTGSKMLFRTQNRKKCLKRMVESLYVDYRVSRYMSVISVRISIEYLLQKIFERFSHIKIIFGKFICS